IAALIPRGRPSLSRPFAHLSKKLPTKVACCWLNVAQPIVTLFFHPKKARGRIPRLPVNSSIGTFPLGIPNAGAKPPLAVLHPSRKANRYGWPLVPLSGSEAFFRIRFRSEI